MFYVDKRTLLLIAGIVWLIAGFNVARLGLLSYALIEATWMSYALSLIIFCLFALMFFNMSTKHTARIMAYTSAQPFWRFFDLKSYAIMVVMMSGGIGLRAYHVLPNFFIAFFYTGLGCALALAGVVFITNYLLYDKLNQKQNDTSSASSTRL